MNIFYHHYLILVLVAVLVPVDSGLTHTWPLKPGISKADVKNGNAVSSEETYSACALGVETGHPKLDYESIKFNAQMDSYIDIPIDSSFSYGDLSVILWLGQPVKKGGVMLHYKTEPSTVALTTNEIHSFKFIMNETDTSFYIQSDNDGIVYLTGSINNSYIDSANEWEPVALNYDKSKGAAFLFTANTETIFENQTMPSVEVMTPGTLRIGSGFDPEDQPYFGRITCVNLYSSSMSLSDVAKSLEFCHTANWNYPPSDFTQDTSGTCEGLAGYFMMAARDASPIPADITTVQLYSKIQCSGACSQTPDCISFTWAQDNLTCRLYTGDHSYETVASPGTSYYIKKYQCC